MTEITKLKLFGERNTGTNYLRKLLKENINITILEGSAPISLRKIQKTLPGRDWLIDLYFIFFFNWNLGWKHSQISRIEKLKKRANIGFITLTKNPYSWLLSLYKRPYHQNYLVKPDFETFLTTPWKTVRRECSKEVYKNPIELWNEKNLSYIILGKECEAINIKYENILRDHREVLKSIIKKFNLTTKKNEFKNIIESTKSDDMNYFAYRKYYLEEEWRKEISSQAIDIINKNIDTYVMSYYNYNKIIG